MQLYTVVFIVCIILATTCSVFCVKQRHLVGMQLCAKKLKVGLR